MRGILNKSDETNLEIWKPVFLLWDLVLTNQTSLIQNHDLWWDNPHQKINELVLNQPKLRIKNFSKISLFSNK